MKLLKHSLSSHTASAVSLAAISVQSTFAVLCPLANRTTIYCFILATGMALALIYTYIFPGWSFSKENSPPKINLLQDKIHNSGPRATDGAFGRTLLQTEYGVWRSPERYRVLTSSGGAKLWTFGLLKEALGSLAPGKAPSQDIIISEILKCYKGDAFTKLYSSL